MDAVLSPQAPPLVLPDPLPVGGPVVARVRALRTGPAKRHVWSGREVFTGAAKEPRAGRVLLGRCGFEGDEQGDTKNHGGPDKAVLAYAAQHYPRWRGEGLDLPEGALFENITLVSEGPEETPCEEATVRVGEVWRLGEAVVQVSQPRNPCWKLARKWGIPDMAVRTQNSGRTGWYLRVLKSGTVAAGDEVHRVAVPEGAVTVAEVTRVLNLDRKDLDGARRLLQAPGILERHRATLVKRLERQTPEDDSRRLYGT